MKVLVAGIGNTFLSDDGFGVAVIAALRERELPSHVELVDTGIRGMHLAYQLLDGYRRGMHARRMARTRGAGRSARRRRKE